MNQRIHTLLQVLTFASKQARLYQEASVLGDDILALIESTRQQIKQDKNAPPGLAERLEKRMEFLMTIFAGADMTGSVIKYNSASYLRGLVDLARQCGCPECFGVIDTLKANEPQEVWDHPDRFKGPRRGWIRAINEVNPCDCPACAREQNKSRNIRN